MYHDFYGSFFYVSFKDLVFSFKFFFKFWLSCSLVYRGLFLNYPLTKLGIVLRVLWLVGQLVTLYI